MLKRALLIATEEVSLVFYPCLDIVALVSEFSTEELESSYRKNKQDD